MIVIDGSFGEGGGQILRSSLDLAAILQVPVKIENIRARRPKPGLASQHLAAARAAAKVCDGELTGAKKGSTELVFRPGAIRAGAYSREIGTAGSTTLIYQTMLLILVHAPRESAVTIHGGTHNPLAPPAEFISECWLPALRPLGIDADCELLLHGFYPKGGGAIRGSIRPWHEMGPPLDLTAETDWGEPSVAILIANLPEHVAAREQTEISARLDLDPTVVAIQPLPGEVGPGNAVLIRYHSGDGRTALITAFGEPGRSAERVAQGGAREAKNFSRSKAAVDPHLADQLILPLALGRGGRFTTSALTEHTRTQFEVLRRFLGIEPKAEMVRPDLWLIEVPAAAKEI